MYRPCPASGTGADKEGGLSGHNSPRLGGGSTVQIVWELEVSLPQSGRRLHSLGKIPPRETRTREAPPPSTRLDKCVGAGGSRPELC